jgi:transposase-like protein
MRKKYDSKFKGRVALEAVRGDRTIAEIAGTYNVHPNQVMQWKKHLIDGASGIFATKAEKKAESQGYSEDDLMRKIGRLEVENDFLREASFAMRLQSGKSR